jgi:hypothetical protein
VFGSGAVGGSCATASDIVTRTATRGTSRGLRGSVRVRLDIMISSDRTDGRPVMFGRRRLRFRDFADKVPPHSSRSPHAGLSSRSTGPADCRRAGTGRLAQRHGTGGTPASVTVTIEASGSAATSARRSRRFTPGSIGSGRRKRGPWKASLHAPGPRRSRLRPWRHMVAAYPRTGRHPCSWLASLVATPAGASGSPPTESSVLRCVEAMLPRVSSLRAFLTTGSEEGRHETELVSFVRDCVRADLAGTVVVQKLSSRAVRGVGRASPGGS